MTASKTQRRQHTATGAATEAATQAATEAATEADLDATHRAITDMARQMASTIAGHNGEAAYERVLQEITAHFAEEEELMRAYDFPQAREHRQAHADFIAALHYFRSNWNFSAGPAQSLGRFIEDWWICHIATSDKQLAEFTAARPELVEKAVPAAR